MNWSGTALVTLRGCAPGTARATAGHGPGNCPVRVSRKILLQIAARNIGQLTDIQKFALCEDPLRLLPATCTDCSRRPQRPALAAGFA